MRFGEPSSWDPVPAGASEPKAVELPQGFEEALGAMSTEQLDRVRQLADQLLTARKVDDQRKMKEYETLFTIHGVPGSVRYVREGGHEDAFQFYVTIPQWDLKVMVEATSMAQLEKFMSGVAQLEQSSATAEQAKERLMKVLGSAPSFGGVRPIHAMRFE